MFFPSKKDWWMGIIIWFCSAVSIFLPIFSLDFGADRLADIGVATLISIILLFLVGTLLIWIWFKTGYWIKESILKVEFGPIKKEININEITSIRAARNPFTAPALSLDKIEINYARFQTIAVSPKNKKEFVRQLLMKNRHIKADNHFDDFME
ncbi:hypothetical protein J27TS8_36240 [Robertmurraya siralis]|uniref:Uncharacterized protein YyaB-like PH domain-containing protein n=1 Tax=Robertmurraya siralis TaxID=77777 RepID=A0A919WKZ7_9BACI|nr:PH domain-containing protein [Robertmurraya siralis]PAE21265.1 hypothetical protein CHH80_07300 [Bacillus sp. 7504-2]GIN63631.1 hypothetical protein J27TS8_36240 [Robertmurraya siralis]